MIRIFIIILLVCLSHEALLAGQKQKNATMEEWLKKRHAQLAAVKEPSKVKKAKLKQSEKPNEDGFYRLYPGKGFLKFKDGSWVLLTSHSSHAEDGIPDISLVRTSTGLYYSNLGHCCLPLLLLSKEKVVSLESFLNTTGKGPKSQPTPWKIYNLEQVD